MSGGNFFPVIEYKINNNDDVCLIFSRCGSFPCITNDSNTAKGTGHTDIQVSCFSQSVKFMDFFTCKGINVVSVMSWANISVE